MTKLQQAKEVILDNIIAGNVDSARAYKILVEAETQEMMTKHMTQPCPECVNPFEDGEEEEIG